MSEPERDDDKPGEETPHETAHPVPSEPEPVDEQQVRIESLESELEQAKDQMLRALAEAENTRKRSHREREDANKYAVSGFAKDLLDFSSNFRRALDAVPGDLIENDVRIRNVIEGITAMEKELLATFERHGIRKIEPLNEPFDPNFHEVIFESPAHGKAPGTVIQLVEPGYVLHDRLLRPARVGVAKSEGQDDSSLPSGEPGSNIDQQV